MQRDVGRKNAVFGGDNGGAKVAVTVGLKSRMWDRAADGA